MSERDGHDLNLPYESVGGDPIAYSEDVHMSGGLVIRSAVAQTPLGPMPLLVFTFARADGAGFLTPIALGVDEQVAAGLTKLVADALRGALQAARG